MSINPSLYLKQIELGPMNNYIYILGDAQTREVMLIDPGWNVAHLKQVFKEEELVLKGLLITHGHPDHTNGIQGMLDDYDIPVYVARDEASFYKPLGNNVKNIAPGEQVSVGSISIDCLHTPGHTPGSQCFKVDHHLIAGDTLFLDGCGRCDLPGGDAEILYASLYNVILKLPNSTILYPGHNYHHLHHDTLENQKTTNPFLQCHSLHDFVHNRRGL